MKKLNFGAGEDIKAGWDNADFDKYHKEINLAFDFNKFPYPIKDNTYDYIHAGFILEHLKEPSKTIQELCRIAKNGAILRILVPHFNSEGAFCLEHTNFWNETSFLHLENPTGKWNAPPQYKLKILELKIIPSKLGKCFYPLWLRRKVSLVLRGIYMHLDVTLRVDKYNK